MHTFYVSSFGKNSNKGIYIVHFDENSDELSIVQHIVTKDYPSYMVIKDNNLYITYKNANRSSDGGGLGSFSIYKDELIINNNEEYPLYVTLLPFTYNEKTVGAVIQCIVSVNSKTAAVTSMLYSDVFVIEPKRLGFFGSVPNKLDELDRPSSDSIRLVQNNFTLDEYKNYYGQTFKISDLYNIGSIVIAIPISWNNDPEKLIYLQQNTDVLELMSVYKQIPIEGGNKYPTEMYDIYYYRFNEIVNTDMNFILYASERNEKPELAKPGNESKCEQIDSIPSDLLNSIISSILN